MAYAEPQDVRNALTPDGDVNDASTAASLDDDDLQKALDEATAEVDGRLRTRYTLPLANVPDLVKSLTVDVAAYLATLTHRRNVPLQSDDPVALRYARAQRLLDLLSRGQITLDVDGDGTAEPAEVTVVNPYEGDLFGPEDFNLVQTPRFVDPMMHWRC